MSFEKTITKVPTLIQYVGTLNTGPLPCAWREGTRFKFANGHGQYIDCYNMVAENFLKLVKLRKMDDISILLYSWEYEYTPMPGCSTPMPETRYAGLVIDHRIPQPYLNLPALWSTPPVDVYHDMVAEASKKRFP